VWWVDLVFQAANYLNIKGLLDLTSILRKKRRFERRISGHLSEAKGCLLIVDIRNVVIIGMLIELLAVHYSPLGARGCLS
jgi:hypothetical protein